MPSRSLDLGCGPSPRNRFGCDEAWGVDLYSSSPNVAVADLVVEPIPFPDGHFDVVECRDFLEHIPRLVYAPARRASFIEVMNEVWRVLVPGGRFFAETPAWPHPEADVDPTHVQTITEGTLAYFTDEAHLRLSRTYGFRGRFTGSQHWSAEFAPWLVWDLRAVK